MCEQSEVLTVSLAAFDPKPFIRTFEAAVDKLIAVRKDVQAKTEQMEKSVRVAERDYSKKMSELNRGFEVCYAARSISMRGAQTFVRKAVGQSFSGMETKMNEVGRTAIRIGEQMESVHQQRQRAQAAYDLIDYYNQFAKDDTTRLDALKKEGKEGRRKVAVLLRRLATVAKEVDLPHSDKVRRYVYRTSPSRAHSNDHQDARKHRPILREVREGYAAPLRPSVSER